MTWGATRLARSVSALCLAALLLTACGGGGGSPTQPQSSSASLSIGIGNADLGRATILAAQLSLDGSVVATFTSAGGPTEFATLVAPAVDIGRGSHTLAVTITDQTSSPNRYMTVGGNVMVVDASGNVRSIDLQNKTATLATGESISYTFSV